MKSCIFFREFNHWHPYGSLEDEEEPDDLDRIVDFVLIAPFLFTFRNGSSQFHLVLHFLKFLGFQVEPSIKGYDY